jgi:hypothetical protein
MAFQRGSPDCLGLRLLPPGRVAENPLMEGTKALLFNYYSSHTSEVSPASKSEPVLERSTVMPPEKDATEERRIR